MCIKKGGGDVWRNPGPKELEEELRELGLQPSGRALSMYEIHGL